LTLNREATLQLLAATLLWLLAAAALPTVIIANGLLVTDGTAAPLDRALIVLTYDVALIASIFLFVRSRRGRGSALLVALVLLPLAGIGVTTIFEQLSFETSTAAIRETDNG